MFALSIPNKMCALLLVSTLLLTGCQNGSDQRLQTSSSDDPVQQNRQSDSQPVVVPRGFDSPQEAFDHLRLAIRSGDADGIRSALTDDGQGTYAGRLIMFLPLLTMRDADAPARVKEVFQAHGVDPQKTQVETPIKSLAALSAAIDDKAGFIADMFKASGIDLSAERGNERLEDLQVHGVTATGTMVEIESAAREPIEFRQVQGGWLVHFPEPQLPSRPGETTMRPLMEPVGYQN